MKGGSSCLSYHLHDSFRCNRKIVFSAGISGGDLRTVVFKVRQPDIYIISKSHDSFYPFITAAVIDNGDLKLVFNLIQSRKDPRKIVGGGYQIDVVGALILQLQENVGKLVYREFFSVKFLTDLVILAETAAQSTAGKEQSAASAEAADTRFFPMVQGSSGSQYMRCGTAEPGGFGAVRTAHAGAKLTVSNLIIQKRR